MKNNKEKTCLICNEPAIRLMSDIILGKHKINYYVCNSCECIFTENPYWLEEAYSEAIAKTDTGIMVRNISICNDLMHIFNQYFDPEIKVVDFGGGYGILTRMLRDSGINAFWQDKYEKNLLSRGFEYDGKSQADVVIAFEVMEHLPNPLETIKEIMVKTDCFIFSTLLLEQLDHKTNKEWWYFGPESGQHIFFATKKTMHKIAKLLDCKYSCINGLHILHKKDLKNRMKFSKLKALLIKVFNKLHNHLYKKSNSKTWDDHTYMKSKINKKILFSSGNK
jgi:2-polyprenyl-3-methyl-5-hydroxy-6-metoxy-1,4-benzoquinol methylase